MASGSALHLALELGQTDPQTIFDLPQGIKVYLEDFRRRIDEGNIFIQWPRIKKMESEGTSMLELYYNDLLEGKFPSPTHVEREFSIPFEGIEIIGKIDAEEVDENGDYTLVDYKSASRKPDLWFLRHDPQFTAYSWAGLVKYGRLPKKIIWHHLRNGLRIETTRTMQDIDDLQQMIRNALKMNDMGIKHRVFHEQVCDFCEYSGARGRYESICDDRELEQRLVANLEKTDGVPQVTT